MDLDHRLKGFLHVDKQRMLTRAAAVAVLLAAMPAVAFATDGFRKYYEEYDKLISSRMSVTALGPDLLGDSVDLYSGALSFSTTDISLPGNGPPVALTRTYDATDRGDMGTDYAFGDWDISLPNISGLFSTAWHNDRCDRPVPPNITTSGTYGSDITFVHSIIGERYWKGNTASMPGGGALLRMSSNAPRPAIGGPYPWITSGRVVFACLPSIKNGAGQGFLAIAPDGTKYWFDWMATFGAPGFEETFEVPKDPRSTETRAVYQSASIARAKNALYVTRVEDRFGNFVVYQYSNSSDRPLRINAIRASDGRQITFHYNAGGRVDSASDGQHTWTYAYNGWSLTTAVLPDGSRWSINFVDFSYAHPQQLTQDGTGWRSCFRQAALDSQSSGPYQGTITHPSGAIGRFTTAPVIHRRTNVPALCENYISKTRVPNYNDPTNDVAIFPINWYALSLTSKAISGPGLTPQTWNYSYTSGQSYFYPDGQDEPYKCDSDTCAEPQCLSLACAGTATTTVTAQDRWKRYTFGNSYRFNEGKLQKVEEGVSADAIARTTVTGYELRQVGTPYPVRIGTSPLGYLGDGFVSEFPRPRVSESVANSGTVFKWEVATGCRAPDAYCLDDMLRPVKVVRSSSPSP